MLDVKVKIELSKVVGKLGFGYPLILKAGVEDAAVPYVVCKSLEEVVAAGFAVESDVYAAAQLVFKQENAPEKIAVFASETDVVAAITSVLDKDWRQLVVLGQNDLATVKTIADVIESTRKMYFACVESIDASLDSEKYDRTVLFVHPSADAVAALVGEAAGREVGSFTYKNLILAGVEPQVYTSAQLEAIHEKGGMTLVTKAGDNVTSEGKSQSGEYIDVTDSIDYVLQQIEYKLQKVLNNTAKVPYDNRGIALLESAVLTVLQDAYNKGIIAEREDGTGDYSVSFAARSETSEEDRANRYYPYGKFTFALAGAIHMVEITGEIIY